VKWYPVFLREMLLFRAKLFRLGYIFSSMFVPLLYLLAFGLGLGRSVRISGGSYLEFLLPGLIAMSSMTNSYNWVASGLNLGRLYFKTFQVLVQAPIPPSAIMIGEILSGMARGLFASLMIIIVGIVVGKGAFLTPIFLAALLLNCFLFSSLGVVVGMITKSHEDTSTYSNFFILPMAFFSGTFFPIDHMPTLLKGIVLMLPLTHTNILMRKAHVDAGFIISAGVLVIYSILIFLFGASLIRNYSE
jgi:Nod factor-specific ABC transporter NodJ protein